MDNSSSALTPTSDQHFLLYFITGMYFAPDLIEGPRKSVLQRRGEGLPPYSMNQLGGSSMNTKLVERVYYYVLCNANQSVILKPPLLHQFFRGSLPTPLKDHTMAYPQFDDLFPTKLHPHARFKNHYEMIGNVVFIHNPDISCIKPGDIERFKKLTGLQDLRLDRASAMAHHSVDGDQMLLYDVPVQEESKSEDFPPHHSVQPLSCVPSSRGIGQFNGMLAFSNHFSMTNNQMSNATVASPTKTSSTDYPEPRKIFLPSFPSREVWDNIVAATKNGFSVTGTVARGNVGPVLGLVDIGESDDSYLFRVSLPGVKRNEREFNCEVENDGNVSISGVTTTGERTVYRYSQAFEMQSQNLCPSGHFSVSFQLPGPVDPRQISGNFGTDGILEGIVLKAGQTSRN